MITAFERYNELKQLQHQQKVITVQFDNLKKQTIAKFLIKRDEVVGPEGLVLFSYKANSQNNFLVAKFKEEEPELYQKYLNTQIVRRFLLK